MVCTLNFLFSSTLSRARPRSLGSARTRTLHLEARSSFFGFCLSSGIDVKCKTIELLEIIYSVLFISRPTKYLVFDGVTPVNGPLKLESPLLLNHDNNLLLWKM